MARRKKGTKEFPVSVNYVQGRGSSSSIPKPVAEALGNPKSITFVLKGKKVESFAGKQTDQ